MAGKTGPLTFRVHDGVATVTLEREHGNAINEPLLDALLASFREAGADPAVRGVLLGGRGKMFCPGLDLQELLPLDRPAMGRFMERFNACVLALYTFPKPVVAALSGHALAGGFILALTADWRVAREGVMVGLNEIKVGVPLPFGVALMLRAGITAQRLHEVALLGRNYAGEAARSAGLVDEIADAEGFEETCRARMEEFGTKDPQAFAVTKRYLRAEVAERTRAHGPRLTAEFLDSWFSSGTRSRITAIVEGLRK